MPSKSINRYAQKLLEISGGSFTTDFQKNKGKINGMGLDLTKTQRNEVAGLITRMMKRLQKAEE